MNLAFLKKNNHGRVYEYSGCSEYMKVTQKGVLKNSRKKGRNNTARYYNVKDTSWNENNSDRWAAYRQLSNIGFQHEVVNHCCDFVSPYDPIVHTQNILSTWLIKKKT
jgi:hypothetical protein